MNTTPDISNLNVGGCRAEEATERGLHNPPGQSALAYRVATHGDFFQRMLTRLSQWSVPVTGKRPLRDLKTRDNDDAAIALLDAWATVGDVLTFYQERIANEGFLNTATERRSVLELARAIGYELDPGVAAETNLVFLLDESQEAPKQAVIPKGASVQSIPAKEGELPQTFETLEDYRARVEWNKLRPNMHRAQQIGAESTELFLAGVGTGLQPGDPILFLHEETLNSKLIVTRWRLETLQSIQVETADGCTRVTWQNPLGESYARLFTFRRRASLFGHNAVDASLLVEDIRKHFFPNEDAVEIADWPSFTIKTDDIVDLDNVYPRIITGSHYVVLAQPDSTNGQLDLELCQVKNSIIVSRNEYGLTAKVTRLKLDPIASDNSLTRFRLRETVAYIESEELALAEKPIVDPIAGREVEVEGAVTDLLKGHRLAVCGKLNPAEEQTVSELAIVESSTVAVEGSHTTILLQQPLMNRYERSSVTIHANVVRASHGESVVEVLGSGDGGQAHQTFRLRHKPLTYVSAATATGSESTLTVRVDGVQWDQVPSLNGLPPDSKSYVVRNHDDGRSTIVFGDGRGGARLPTGEENVVATYRSGIGIGGQVGDAALKLFKKRPFGVREVFNPLAASGGADPEQMVDARRNAPSTTLTLDRVVSLRDYEDFARTFAGIGKATAVPLIVGRFQVVHLTIAGAGGAQIPSDTKLYTSLKRAIAGARDPLQEVLLGGYQPWRFNLRARILIDPKHTWAIVRANVETALKDAFRFQRREFAEPLSSAEVIKVMHSVEGVVAVDLDEFYLLNKKNARRGPLLSTVLVAQPARPNVNPGAGEPDVLPAELLMINPAGIDLVEMS